MLIMQVVADEAEITSLRQKTGHYSLAVAQSLHELDACGTCMSFKTTGRDYGSQRWRKLKASLSTNTALIITLYFSMSSTFTV